MPTHPSKTYSTRNTDAITDIVIHHTVSPNDFLTENLAHYHIQTNDWPGIGYHFVVDYHGRIEQVNKLDTISYHAAGFNTRSIGMALKGNFTDEPPTNIQLDATAWLVAELRGQLGELEVRGHKEVPGASTACPGATWPAWRDAVI